MTYKNEEKRKEALKRYKLKKHIEKFGPGIGDMRGKHGNHAKGPDSGKWNKGKIVTSHGYELVRVPNGHHLKQAHGYAYNHQVVAEIKIGRRLCANEIVHHKDGNKLNNKPSNLEIKTSNRHAKEHDIERGRDKKGRFR